MKSAIQATNTLGSKKRKKAWRGLIILVLPVYWISLTVSVTRICNVQTRSLVPSPWLQAGYIICTQWKNAPKSQLSCGFTGTQTEVTAIYYNPFSFLGGINIPLNYCYVLTTKPENWLLLLQISDKHDVLIKSIITLLIGLTIWGYLSGSVRLMSVSLMFRNWTKIK